MGHSEFFLGALTAWATIGFAIIILECIKGIRRIIVYKWTHSDAFHSKIAKTVIDDFCKEEGGDAPAAINNMNTNTIEAINLQSKNSFNGWSTEKNLNGVIHIYPNTDSKHHTIDNVQCKCSPSVCITEYSDGTDIIVSHYSYDGREFFEQDYDNIPDYLVYRLYKSSH